jgi:hypothetical protein
MEATDIDRLFLENEYKMGILLSILLLIRLQEKQKLSGNKQMT